MMLSTCLALIALGSPGAGPGVRPAAHEHAHAHSCATCGGHHVPGRVGELVAAAYREADREDVPPATAPPEQGPPNPADNPKMVPDRDVQRDINAGRQYAAEIDKILERTEDREMQERVERIGAILAEIANQQAVDVMWGDRRFAAFPYEFRVVKGDDVNAFSLPGGIIYVYEGLVKFAESRDELAGVLAHEISHAAFRHVATLERERSRLDILNIPLIIAAVLSRDPNAARAMTGANLATQGLVSGWSVQAETAADFGALQYMRQSQFNPVAVLTFMERLAFREQLKPQVQWGIYQTHPPSVQRAAFILRWLNEQGIPVRRSEVTTSLSAKNLPVENHFELWFGNVRIHTFRGEGARDRGARALLRLNEFMDSVPQTFQFRPSGPEMLGNGRTLFVIEPQDAGDPEQTVATMSAASSAALRRVIYDLRFRLWAVPPTLSPVEDTLGLR